MTLKVYMRRKAVRTIVSKLLGRAGITCLSGLIMAGCQSITEEKLKPALLESVDQSSHAQIEQVIKDEFGSQELRIAESAFIQRSSVTIMMQARRTVDNQNLQGRDMQKPMRFKLMKSSSNCYLVLDSNSKSWKLPGVTCRYE